MIGFILGFVLFLVIVAGVVMVGQALVSDFDEVVAEERRNGVVLDTGFE